MQISVVEQQLASEFKVAVERYTPWLLWGIAICVLAIPFILLVAFLAVIFVPVIFRDRRERGDYLRTLFLTGGFVFFLVYHSGEWTFVPSLQGIYKKIMDKLSEIPPVMALVVLCLAEAVAVSVAVSAVFSIWDQIVNWVKTSYYSLDVLAGQIEQGLQSVRKSIFFRKEDWNVTLE